MAKANIGIAFKKAVKKNFPKNHILHSTINEHTVKLSYSTTPNMAAKMGAHNNKIEASNLKNGEERPCSCPKTKGKKSIIVCSIINVWKRE